MRERSLSEETGMGMLFRPKGVCAWGLGRRAGRARICGSGLLRGSLSDSVSMRKTSGCRAGCCRRCEVQAQEVPTIYGDYQFLGWLGTEC